MNTLYNVSTHSSQTSPQTSAHPTRLAPSQTRILPLTLTQLRSLPTFVQSISLKIVLKSATSTDKTSMVIELPVTHITDKDVAEWEVSQIKASYFYADSMPSNFGVLPPTEKTPQGQVGPRPYVLALRMLSFSTAVFHSMPLIDNTNVLSLSLRWSGRGRHRHAVLGRRSPKAKVQLGSPTHGSNGLGKGYRLCFVCSVSLTAAPCFTVSMTIVM